MIFHKSKPKKSNEIPEDLGIVMKSKEEAYWLNVKEKTEHEIETLESMLKFNKAILEMAIDKIAKSN